MSTTIQEDVSQEVARCAVEGSILRIAPAATRITARHAGQGVTASAVASMLLSAGIEAAVPIEIARPAAVAG